jgi:hypothetical protein
LSIIDGCSKNDMRCPEALNGRSARPRQSISVRLSEWAKAGSQLQN